MKLEIQNGDQTFEQIFQGLTLSAVFKRQKRAASDSDMVHEKCFIIIFYLVLEYGMQLKRRNSLP